MFQNKEVTYKGTEILMLLGVSGVITAMISFFVGFYTTVNVNRKIIIIP